MANIKSKDYDLIIIAAGNGSRIKDYSDLPKALVPLMGQPNLFFTLEAAYGKVDNIYVISNRSNYETFREYIDKFYETFKVMIEERNQETSIHLIAIDSGKGDGHAVRNAIQEISAQHGEFKLADKFFVMWGDAYLFDSSIFDTCIEYDKAYDVKPMLVPVVFEKNPYVSFLLDSTMKCVSVDFSKYGEHHPSGYHDQSIFLCCKTCVENSLDILEAMFNKNGRYVSETGENTFLYLIHYFHNIEFSAQAIILDNPVTMGFNSGDELKAIVEYFGKNGQPKNGKK